MGKKTDSLKQYREYLNSHNDQLESFEQLHIEARATAHCRGSPEPEIGRDELYYQGELEFTDGPSGPLTRAFR